MIRDLKAPESAAVIQRHADYFHRTLRIGPLFRLGGQPAHREREAPPPIPLPRAYEPPEPLDEVTFRVDIEATYDRHGLLWDDFIRMIHTDLPGFISEVLVGCSMVEGVTSWAEPCFTDWHQLDGYRVQETIWYRRIMDNTRHALDAVDPETYPFCCMGLRGPVDMARAIMGGETLCAAVIDHPRELKSLLARITDIVIEMAQAHGALLPLRNEGQFNHEGVWAPGRTAAYTVDAAWMFSPTCYEEFFLPCDIRICDAFDSTVIHLHSASRQHFLAFAEIPKVNLQCSVDEIWLPTGERKNVGPSMGELLPLFKAMCERTTLMIDGYWDDDVFERAIETLPQGKYALRGSVEDPAAVRRTYTPERRFKPESPGRPATNHE